MNYSLSLNRLFLLSIFLWTLTGHAQPRSIDGVAAIVDDQVITVSDLRKRLKESSTPNSKYMTVLDSMIEEKLIDIDMQQRGIAVSRAEVDQAVDQVMAQNGLSSRAELIQSIRAQNIAYSEFEDNLRNQIKRSKFLNYIVAPNVKISELDIEDYYNRFYRKQQGERAYRIRNIFAKRYEDSDKKAKNKINDAYSRLKKGIDFEKVARNVSDGPMAKRGGMLGVFTRAELQSAFFEAIKDLKPGQFSDVVETPQGYYIFQLVALERTTPKDLESAKKEIQVELQEREISRALKSWVRKARERAYVSIKISSQEEI